MITLRPYQNDVIDCVQADLAPEKAKQHRLSTTKPEHEARRNAVKVPRDCNLCGKHFDAPTRFIRTCTPCKNPKHK